MPYQGAIFQDLGATLRSFHRHIARGLGVSCRAHPSQRLSVQLQSSNAMALLTESLTRLVAVAHAQSGWWQGAAHGCAPTRLGLQVLSAVFCLSVVFGNISLKYIPVSFNQAISATTPFFTAVGSFVIQRKTESTATYATLIPVVGGIVIASRFEPSFDTTGFLSCLSATSLRALKSILQVRPRSGSPP